MKQKFILVLTIIAISLFSASVNAQEKLVLNAGNAEFITIATDLDIVLLPGTASDKSMLFDSKVAENLSVKLSGNSLSIGAISNHSNKGKTIVYLYVSSLKRLTVEGNSTVKTIGALDLPMLEVYIDGETRVHLITRGEIKAYSLTESDIEIQHISDSRVAKR